MKNPLKQSTILYHTKYSKCSKTEKTDLKFSSCSWAEIWRKAFAKWICYKEDSAVHLGFAILSVVKTFFQANLYIYNKNKNNLIKQPTPNQIHF